MADAPAPREKADLKGKLREVPHKPGVYLMRDRLNRVIYVGFAVAVVASIALATPRIAIASGTAFLMAQLLDVRVFDRLRAGS